MYKYKASTSVFGKIIISDLILVKHACRWEDNVFHGELVGCRQEEVVEVSPRGGVRRARVAVIHGRGAWPLVLVLEVNMFVFQQNFQQKFCSSFGHSVVPKNSAE